MPIPRAKQQRQTQSLPDVRDNTRYSANDFGAAVGKGLQDVGRSAAQIAAIDEREQNKTDNLVLTKAGTEADRATLELGNEFKSKQLGDAPAAKQDTLQRYDEKLNAIEIPEHLKERWEVIKEKKRLVFQGGVESHERQQFKALEAATEKNQIETSTELAVSNRQNQKAVMLEVGKVVGLIRGNAGESKENRTLGDEKAKAAAGKIYTNVITEALENNELEVARQYIDDVIIKELIPERLLNKFKDDLDNRETNRDIYVTVKDAVDQQELASDFSQEAFDKILEDNANRFKDDPKALEKNAMFERQLRSSWNDARIKQNRRNAEQMELFDQQIKQPGMTMATAQFIANQQEPQLRGAANARVAAQFAGEQGETSGDGIDTNQDAYEEQIARDAIASGLITNKGDLIAKMQSRLPADAIKRLEKLFDQDQGKAIRAIDTDLNTVLKQLQPDADRNEMTRLKSIIGPIVRERMANTEPTYEKIESITKFLLMDVKTTTAESRLSDPSRLTPRETAQRTIATLGDIYEITGTSDEAIQQRADRFEDLVPIVIPEGEKDKVLQEMRADGLDPEQNDPREYYRTKYLDLPPLGSSFAIESRKRATRGLAQIAREEASLAREQAAFGKLRQSANAYTYRNRNGEATAFGSRAMLLKLEDDAQDGLVPDWMTQTLRDMGKDAGNNQALDKFYKKLSATDDKSALILQTGQLLLARAASNG